MSNHARRLAAVTAMFFAGLAAIVGAAPVYAAESHVSTTLAPTANVTVLALPQLPQHIATVCARTYRVQGGDWLSRIAARNGTSWQALAALNRLSNPNRIFVGEVLCVAGTAGSTPTAAAATVAPTNSGGGAVSVGAGEPCGGPISWPANISAWTVPAGCYAGVFTPNTANYPNRPSFGWCSWWPEALHPQYSGSQVLNLPTHSQPAIGATIKFAPGEQGASGAGHYAVLVAMAPGGYWMLISEMNDTWRGAGFGRINYRFIHLSPGVTFLY